MADLLRFKDVFKEGHPLKFNDLHVSEYRPGEDDLTNYRAYRRKRAYGAGTGEGGPVGESYDPAVDESLNIQQRMARSRAFKRIKAKLAVGRRRAKMKMADKKKLEKRARIAARKLVLKKILKDVPKDELSPARKQEIEKRLEKPQVKARINMLAKRLLPKVRKAEVERKKG